MAKDAPKKLLIPRDRSELVQYIDQIGARRRTIAEINVQTDEKIAALNADRTKALQPELEKLDELVSGAAAYAQAHRNDLTGGTTKTVELATGTITWRLSPWKCTVRKWDELVKLMLVRAKRNKLIGSLLRYKVEFDKEGAIANREAVEKLALPGVEFNQEEVLTIKPKGQDDELTISGAQLKRLVA